MKKTNWKILFAVLGTIGVCIPVEAPPKQKKDFLLIFLQCALGLLAFILPTILCYKWKLEIPSGLYFLYYLFLYHSIFLGEVRSFYYAVPNWDTYLHLFSGGMLGIIGFSVLHLLSGQEQGKMALPPLLAAVFVLCFSIALGVVWEIYEYTADALMNLNMQKFALADGTALVGRAAVVNTMKDMIADTVGAAIISVVTYFSLKHKKGWLEKLLVKKERKAT